MFKLWFVGEAGWRHNRLNLFFAAISLMLAVVSPSSGSLVIALVVVGSLLFRIALWELRRTGTRLELSRVSRNQR